MPTASAAASSGGLVAVVVVTDGERWLLQVLRQLARQTADLTVVAVDNASTDRSAELLRDALPEEQRVHLTKRTGFGRAVAAAIGQTVAGRAERLLLVHDDLLLAPDAAAELSAALDADPTLGLVGSKLRGWSDEAVLVEFGQTVDAFGRVEPSVEPGEVDQGQRDEHREAFAVPTAGMMVRRRLLADIGGFDARYHLFRDDVDLCWRARVAGWRVEVAPEAVGYHLGAASGGFRDLGRPGRARELAERHTVATTLKNYGLMRLLGLLPVAVALGAAKIVAFVALRRFSDAGAVLRAYGWNLVQLPLTLRRRRRVQRRRRVPDAQITSLFAPGLPRLRTYGDAVANWVAGGSPRALPDEGGRETRVDDVAGWRAWMRRAGDHPAVPVGVGLLVVYVIGVGGLLGPGALRGGNIDAWPSSAGAFFAAAFAPLESAALSTGTVGSPTPALLGVVSLLSAGSDWVASRVLVLGALPVAWLAALRAGRLLTARSGPRVFGATVYVLSPAVLGALGVGALEQLAVAALLPMVVALAVHLAGDDVGRRASRWRIGALLAISVVAVGALAPSALAVVVALLALSAGVGLGDSERRRAGLVRLVAAVGAGLVPLIPWMIGLVRAGWEQAVPARAVEPMAWWQGLAAVPSDVPLAGGVLGVIAAAGVAAIAAGAVWLGFRHRPGLVAVLMVLAVGAGGLAWLLAGLGRQSVSPGALLVAAALAHAALAVLAARLVTERLSAHAFGLRQLGLVALSLVVIAGLAGGLVRLVDGAGEELTRDDDPMPAFVRADLSEVGPYRVLLVDGAADGGLRWELVDAAGPTMTRYGAAPDPALVAAVDAAVTALGGGADLRGGGLLGAANVRYLVAGDLPADAAAAFDRQPDLEPEPADVAVWQVRSWLPRAVVRPPNAARAAREGDPGDAGDAAHTGLLHTGAGRWAGDRVPPEGGALLVAEADPDRWEAVGDGEPLEPLDAAVGAAFAVPAGVDNVAASHDTPVTGWLSPVLLLVVLAGAVAVVARPPGTWHRRRQIATVTVASPEPPTVITSSRPRLVSPVAEPVPAEAEPAETTPGEPGPVEPTAPDEPAGPGEARAGAEAGGEVRPEPGPELDPGDEADPDRGGDTEPDGDEPASAPGPDGDAGAAVDGTTPRSPSGESRS